jgi:hypothetical protein
LKTLNSALDEGRLEPQVVEKAFDTYWPQFEKELAACLENTDPTVEVKPRPVDDLLAEILENTRSIGSRILALEKTQDQPEDELDASIQRRGDTLLSMEAIKMLKDGIPELEVLSRMARRVGPDPKRLVWIMNRATRLANSESLQPAELASEEDIYASALRGLEGSASDGTTRKKGRGKG